MNSDSMKGDSSVEGVPSGGAPDSGQFQIESTLDEERGLVRICLSGSLDFNNYAQLEDELLRWIDGGQPSWIIDIDQLKSLTSVAAAGFVGLLRVAQDHGGNVFVIEPPDEIMAIFDGHDVAELMPWVGRDV